MQALRRLLHPPNGSVVIDVPTTSSVSQDNMENSTHVASKMQTTTSRQELVAVYNNDLDNSNTVIDFNPNMTLDNLIIENRAYVPLSDAKAALQHVREGAQAMHARHLAAVDALLASFSTAERDTKVQFAAVLRRLKLERQVENESAKAALESLRVELTSRIVQLEAQLRELTEQLERETAAAAQVAATTAVEHAKLLETERTRFQLELQQRSETALRELSALRDGLRGEVVALQTQLTEQTAEVERQRQESAKDVEQRDSKWSETKSTLEVALREARSAIAASQAQLTSTIERADKAEQQLHKLEEALKQLKFRSYDEKSTEENTLADLRAASAAAISALTGDTTGARSYVGEVGDHQETVPDDSTSGDVVERVISLLINLQQHSDGAGNVRFSTIPPLTSVTDGSSNSNEPEYTVGGRTRVKKRNISMFAIDGKITEENDGAHEEEYHEAAMREGATGASKSPVATPVSSKRTPIDEQFTDVPSSRRNLNKNGTFTTTESKLDDAIDVDNADADGDINDAAKDEESNKSDEEGEGNESDAQDHIHKEADELENTADTADDNHAESKDAATSNTSAKRPTIASNTTTTRMASKSLAGGDQTAKLRAAERTIQQLRASLRQLESSSKTATGAGKGSGSAVDEKAISEAVERAKSVLERKWKKERDELEKDAKKASDAAARKLAKAAAELTESESALVTITAERDELKRKAAGSKGLEAEVEQLRAEVAIGKQAAVDLTAATARVTELDKLYRDEQLLRKKYWNMMEDMKGKIRVYCRARPMSSAETARGNTTIVSFPDDVTIDLDVGKGRENKAFVFDSCFGPMSTQEEVFVDTENLVQSAFDGYNVAIFAYGQTGSGKTFTMVGSKHSPGITPRAVRKLFHLISKSAGVFDVTVEATMVELYLDNIQDLLWRVANPRAKQDDAPKLEIKKDERGLVVVRGAVTQICTDADAVLTLFDTGNAVRHVGSTNMNAESSRSHLVFSLSIKAVNVQTRKTAMGKLSLIDLAGSERVGKTGAAADRLKEAQSINKSLSALGNVIAALSNGDSFIPYRDNKLTQLMSDSLGGNAKTLMFVNISPADYNADETLTSLQYAARVKLITNSAERMQESAEVARLKAIIAALRAGGHPSAALLAEAEEETEALDAGNANDGLDDATPATPSDTANQDAETDYDGGGGNDETDTFEH